MTRTEVIKHTICWSSGDFLLSRRHVVTGILPLLRAQLESVEDAEDIKVSGTICKDFRGYLRSHCSVVKARFPSWLCYPIELLERP